MVRHRERVSFGRTQMSVITLHMIEKSQIKNYNIEASDARTEKFTAELLLIHRYIILTAVYQAVCVRQLPP